MPCITRLGPDSCSARSDASLENFEGINKRNWIYSEMITGGRYFKLLDVSPDKNPNFLLKRIVCDSNIKAFASSPNPAKKNFKVR